MEDDPTWRPDAVTLKHWRREDECGRARDKGMTNPHLLQAGDFQMLVQVQRELIQVVCGGSRERK